MTNRLANVVAWIPHAHARTAPRMVPPQTRTLDYITPESLVQFYGLPLAIGTKLIQGAKLARLRQTHESAKAK